MEEETKTFLIECRETEWGEKVVFTHGFSHQLIEAVHYQNWLYEKEFYDLKFTQQIGENMEGDLIPVGSLKFVFDYMDKVEGIDTEDIEPINIPEELKKKKYLKRKIEDKVYNSSISPGKNGKFVKSATQYDGYTGIISNTAYVPEDQYLVSKIIDIKSEFRVFIFDGEIKDIKNYKGDYFTLPDFNLIQEMVDKYVSSPLAYTIDVAVTKEDNAVLIECHPFVSCGLYGFRDYKVLPQMMIAGYKYIKESG